MSLVFIGFSGSGMSWLAGSTGTLVVELGGNSDDELLVVLVELVVFPPGLVVLEEELEVVFD